MTMLLIAKELAEAVVKSHTTEQGYMEWCDHCDRTSQDRNKLNHDSNCIVVRAKLLLEQEWGIKS